MNNIKRNITFNEAFHKYTDEFNLEYISVTTLISKYHKQFDKEYWANKKAKELGTTSEIIKQSWKEITDFSCEKGNKEHKLLEDSINEANGKAKFDIDKKDGFGFKDETKFICINRTNLYILSNSKLAIKYPKIYEYLRVHIEEGWSLYAEKRTYWAEYLIAGTIDCLLVKDKLFKIVDWKTNKDELKFTSGYYKKVNGIKTNTWIDKKEYFFQPIQGIEYCKGNVYTMQLSLYAYILELWGMECIGLTLFHIRDNEVPRAYNLIYQKLHCQLLLVDFKNHSFSKPTNLLTTKNNMKFGIN